jgi:hypothetical protein
MNQEAMSSAERLIVLAERYKWALERIRIRASSDLPAEELEDAQSDLRAIHEIAESALSGPTTPHK